jgi:hypothetical protein
MVALVLAAVVVLALFAQPVQAETHELVLGHGQHPSAVFSSRSDGSRFVHAVWATTSGFDESEGVLNAIGYCRWRLGAPACENRQTLLVMGREGEFSSPEITRYFERRVTDPNPIRAPGTDYTEVLVITDARCCGADQTGRWVLTSRDGGDTWGGARVSRLGSAHGSMLHRAGNFELISPRVVDAPAGPSLTMIGSEFATFGLPVALDHVADLNAPMTLNTEFPDFADDGAQRVYAEGMGTLRDGRPFAVGYPGNDRGGAAFVRTALPGANPRDVAGGWTPWQPFALPRGRESVHTTIEDVARYEDTAPALLEGEILRDNDVLWAVPFDGGVPGRRTLLSGATGTPVADSSVGSLVVFGDNSYALWPTQQEGCPRGRRCLVWRKTERPSSAWTGPEEIVRSVPRDGPYLGGATLAVGFADQEIAATWSERRDDASGLPVVRLRWLCQERRIRSSCQRHEWNSGERHGAPYARLDAPNLVTGRSFTARVLERKVDRVRLTLLPPSCRPPSTGDSCFAFRRPVRVADDSAPFSAQFKRLPVNPNASTLGFWQNRLCGVDAYLYRLRARVTFTEGTRKTLWRNVSVCPPLK